VFIRERRLPHWSQAGTLAFITFRTNDSIPAVLQKRWHARRQAWLECRGIDVKHPNWHSQLRALPLSDRIEYYDTFPPQWHGFLDRGLGLCPLKQTPLADIVSESLLAFDNERYCVSDFVIMPNHVHIMAGFPDQTAMLNQCENWKHFQAFSMNRILGRKGRFWQQDCFDHLLRSEAQFNFLQRYIADNPRLAQLHEGEYRHYSRARK
jgi:type I restriction enzyme R subunit